MLRRFLIWLGVGLLALMAAGAVLCVGYVCRSEESFWPDEKFTAERWNATPQNERHVMAKDLVQSRILEGMTKNDVISLLGHPESSGIKEDGTIRDNISYYLKDGSTSISLNAVWLLRVLFDPATGTVQKYGIGGD
jgi:hypothetical protein